ncbi:SGNH/GDSL hydrolase family protein [Altererythrobacter salegens]|uniref:SGNH/GDSL hydrolase family protein n=1 Tax=Croceibacterium salegens TaxID=1737568 RepID=A0A6I4SWY2_9SPHN|nr:SGNH/GDSL hydrolase family protein [Croceibacterium salegens]MXO59948.1 SGNH/GDSL hydrolase family protein [Croceibacterium salegens]
MIVRTGAGGPEFRIEFANVQGGEPIRFAAIHAALAGPAGSIIPSTDRTVTFGGRESLTLFPGSRAVSDPVPLAAPPLTEVAVSVYLPDEVQANTVDEIGLMPTYIAAGNQTSAESLDEAAVAGSYFWLRGLSVPTPDVDSGTIVAFGDSITEGYATTFGAHMSWPELLAVRLQKDPELSNWSVVNAGISGNRVLRTGAGESALARFTDDVLGRPGVKWVIVLESINDINFSIMPGFPRDQAATADELIAGLDQLITRAHLHGIKIAGGTVMATKGLPFYSQEGEAMRQAVNDWIRTSGRFDAVIDFDAATRDPADPLRIRPDLDPGDHVHPNDDGNRIMADTIDLDIFRTTK